MQPDDPQTTDLAALMAEIQQDERAFLLLHAALVRAGEGATFGSVLRERGDPRAWPQYANAR